MGFISCRIVGALWAFVPNILLNVQHINTIMVFTNRIFDESAIVCRHLKKPADTV